MSVYFVADLHMQPERPDISRAFLHFLQTKVRTASALYLLGDIFEAWIGDDAPMPGLDEIFHELKSLSDQGCKLYFQHGNRDFLVGNEFCKLIGATLLPEQIKVSLPCGEALLLHGDQLCTDDIEYQQFRSQIRDPRWISGFLAKPVSERLETARQLREASKARGAEKQAYITDVNATAVETVMNQASVKLLIHGHTHRPAIHSLPDTNTRIVLGDWDTSGWYLEVDTKGYQLIDFPIGS